MKLKRDYLGISNLYRHARNDYVGPSFWSLCLSCVESTSSGDCECGCFIFLKDECIYVVHGEISKTCSTGLIHESFELHQDISEFYKNLTYIGKNVFITLLQNTMPPCQHDLQCGEWRSTIGALVCLLAMALSL